MRFSVGLNQYQADYLMKKMRNDGYTISYECATKINTPKVLKVSTLTDHEQKDTDILKISALEKLTSDEKIALELKYII